MVPKLKTKYSFIFRRKNKIPNYLVFTQALVDMYRGGVASFETVVEVMVRSKIIKPGAVTDIIYAGNFCASINFVVHQKSLLWSVKAWFRRETRKLVTSRFSFILLSCRGDKRGE